MFRHTIWLLGFRPFFLLAALAGIAFPPIWAAAFAGAITLPADGLPAMVWHAHEMFYGFGWAVLGGFLLTASRNWVKTRGLHGGPLALAVGPWLLGRVAVFLDPSLLRLALLNAFELYLIAFLVFEIGTNFRKGSPQNAWFLVALPLFLLAKNLLIHPAGWVHGAAITLGLFRMAFALMFERLIPMFMRNAMGVTVPRWSWLDTAIKALLLIGAFETLLPQPLAAVVLGAAGLLLLGRFGLWSPQVGLRRFEIGVMYVGMAGLGAHLLLDAAQRAGWFLGVGTLSVHTFTLLVMGIVIPAMLVRVSLGHTGRPLIFPKASQVALWFMGLAAALRLGATQLWPGAYDTWIALSAAAWSLCFVVILALLLPMLTRPRVDGKEI